ncbi:MAG TPA: c-type cytochrome [Thermoanaerobaculia bacterium]|nr:c-type cytochrome [Thermoanaerobaculia bacterium]
MSSRPRPRFVLFAAAALALAPAAFPQEAWKWPEHPKNLKALPADTGPEKLSAIMRGFTRSLGVRCQYCHVGQEGKPLSTFDFASDANPNKDRARQMYKMLGVINAQLKDFPRSGPKVNMWCNTCHAGRPKPTTLGEELDLAYGKGGAAAAVDRYHELRTRYYGRGGYDFGERSLEEFGGGLLEKHDNDGAVAILKLNADMFPESGDAQESLGDAYAAGGKADLAASAYRKAVALDPHNGEAKTKLEKLEAPPKSPTPGS